MQVNNKNLSIQTLGSPYRRTALNLHPPYQRNHEGVWNLQKKQLLCDSILRGYDIPKFYVRKIDPPVNGVEQEVVDGQQRIRAIYEFLDDRYSLGGVSHDLPAPIGDVSGMRYSQLDTQTKDIFGAFNLDIKEIQNETEEEVRDQFSRLQEGVPLNPQEKRNALMGGMRDFVAELAGTDEGTTPHNALSLSHIADKRYEWDNLIALVTCLELANGPIDVKAPSLKKMYETEDKFDSHGAIAKRIRKILNIMARVLKGQPPEMRNKWGFVDLYLLISTLEGVYVLSGREDEIASTFIEFEGIRLSALESDDGIEALLKSGDPWDGDVYSYTVAFQTGGGTAENVRKRHEVLLRWFMDEINDLVWIDPKRVFSSAERIILWRQAGEECEHCGEKVDLSEMHADHGNAHSTGGPTKLSNARCLCADCNLSTSAL